MATENRPRRGAQSKARIDVTLSTLAQKDDVEGLKTEIHRGVVETQRWMIATVIGLFVWFGGLFLAMSNALKPSPQQAQQPINIKFPSAAQPVPSQPTPHPLPK